MSEQKIYVYHMSQDDHQIQMFGVFSAFHPSSGHTNCRQAAKCHVKHGWIGGVRPIVMEVHSTMLCRFTSGWEGVKFPEKNVLNKT